ncbi:hypothetical protein HELRODRAFT_170928 [Helobdella robusta]|uniref:Endonuclease/exonuclease/phosphatase domain-containing protein n=1 Tax=Helobdella robusta TaxID=6412 RepID=T1F3L8_HELRO|nr:hypothetical protein HELRODRAFT_170928 [Helobdella robusta]ESO06893.1 hypothetical protein HELRODRAFT_170928 [Helobdella robusta]
MKKLNDVNKKIISEVVAIRAAIDGNESKLTHIDTSGAKLSGEIASLKSELNRSFASVVSGEMKKGVQSINQDVKIVQKKLQDVVDNKEREANIIMFNLKEGSDDNARVCQILDHLTEGVCGEKNVLKMMRLGKKNDNAIRPILIKFNNIEAKSHVFNGIRKMKTLKDDLACTRLSHDFSIDQRAVLKKLLKEAKEAEEGCKQGFLYRVRGEVNGIHGLICDGLDILVLTETWHGVVGNNSVRLAMPPGFWYVDYVRQHDPGHGGLIVYFRKDFGYKKLVLPLFATFEAVSIRFSTSGYQFILLAIYRPGSAQISSLFFDELISVLEYVTMLNANILMMGDFNVHIERVNDIHTVRLNEILDAFQMISHVHEPTHEQGGILDLVISSSNFPILGVEIFPSGIFSDHGFVKVGRKATRNDVF